MVCKDCQRGAELAFMPPYGSQTRRRLNLRARKAHARCKGCDCQHATDQSYIQMEYKRDLTKAGPEVPPQAAG